MVTNSTGGTVSQEFDPWGKVRSGGTSATKRNFTGQYLDDTGLLFYNARYYDPAIGRFLSADTVVPNPGNPQDFNRYAYVNNNPVNRTDPTGHWAYDDPLKCSCGYYGAARAAATQEAARALQTATNATVILGVLGTQRAEVNDRSEARVPPANSDQAAGQTAGPGGIDPDDPKQNSDDEPKFAKGKLQQHFTKHGAENNYKNPEDYLKAARNTIKEGLGGKSSDVLSVRRSDGSTIFWRRSTEEFLVLERGDKTIRTFFKPKEGFEYWLKEVNK